MGHAGSRARVGAGGGGAGGGEGHGRGGRQTGRRVDAAGSYPGRQRIRHHTRVGRRHQGAAARLPARQASRRPVPGRQAALHHHGGQFPGIRGQPHARPDRGDPTLSQDLPDAGLPDPAHGVVAAAHLRADHRQRHHGDAHRGRQRRGERRRGRPLSDPQERPRSHLEPSSALPRQVRACYQRPGRPHGRRRLRRGANPGAGPVGVSAARRHHREHRQQARLFPAGGVVAGRDWRARSFWSTRP